MHEKYPFVSNPLDSRFLALRSLQTHQGRSRTGLCIIEGIRHLARAVEHNAPIESVFLEPSVLSNPFGQKLARRLRKTWRTGHSAIAPTLPRPNSCRRTARHRRCASAAVDSIAEPETPAEFSLPSGRVYRITGKSGHDDPSG
jgi:hypothetical protein